jgi:deoxyribodipyrimidine photo-lyase
MIQPVPPVRVRTLGGTGEGRPGSGDYVLYWMVAQRRARWNFALQHAAWQAERLGKPLVVLEALRGLSGVDGVP